MTERVKFLRTRTNNNNTNNKKREKQRGINNFLLKMNKNKKALRNKIKI